MARKSSTAAPSDLLRTCDAPRSTVPSRNHPNWAVPPSLLTYALLAARGARRELGLRYVQREPSLDRAAQRRLGKQCQRTLGRRSKSRASPGRGRTGGGAVNQGGEGEKSRKAICRSRKASWKHDADLDVQNHSSRHSLCLHLSLRLPVILAAAQVSAAP